MTDNLTTEIRRALTELVDAAPLPPEFDGLEGRRARRRPGRAVLAMACVAVAALVGGFFFVVPHDRRATTVTVRPSSQGSPPAIEATTPRDPTFVSPTNLPAGLRLVESGSNRLRAHVSREILLADQAGRTARLGWSTATCTNLPAGPSGARFVLDVTHQIPTLEWCDHKNRKVDLWTTGFDEAAARAVATTVTPAPGHPGDLTVVIPQGFVAGRVSTGSIAYSLVFRPDTSSSSRPEMNVFVTGPWSTDLKLMKAQADTPSSATIDVAGHPAFLVQTGNLPRYQTLVLLYDNHTVVAFNADGLTAQQLIAAATSLAPASPSLAPNVSRDLPLCQDLGLCS